MAILSDLLVTVCLTMSAQTEAADQEEREYLAEIRAHRAGLVQRFGENWSEKDKVVVSISSIAFGFTVGFLPRVGVTWPLIAAWLSFAVSICTVVLSYDLNASQLKRSIQRIDEWVEDNGGHRKPHNGTYIAKIGGREVRVVDTINTVSVYMLIAGVIFTVAFAQGAIR